MGEIVAAIFDKISSAVKDVRMCSFVCNLGNNHSSKSPSKLKEGPRDGVAGSLMGRGRERISLVGEKRYLSWVLKDDWIVHFREREQYV